MIFVIMADGVTLFSIVFFFGIICTSPFVFAEERKITITEKRCPFSLCQNKNFSIVHVVAESIDKRNSIHYLWSVIYSPTIIVAYFEKTGVNVSLEWDKIISKNESHHGIHFTEHFDYITALVIPAFYEFQDPKDKLDYTNKDVTDIVKHPFNLLTWARPDVDPENNMTTFKASMPGGGDVIFQCNASFSSGRESSLPRQQFSSNTTIFTLTLIGLHTNVSDSRHTRFIFELSSFEADHSTTCVKADRSFDDEYTPAVFKTVVVNSTGSGGGVSYSAWKPVAYTSKTRSLDCQIPSYQYYNNKHHFIQEKCQPLPIDSSVFRPLRTIAYNLKEPSHWVSYGINISFGKPKDGWYDGREGSRYLSWSAVVGYGTPLPERLSTGVLIIIIVGFGTPILLIILSVVYVIARKLRVKKAASSYSIIN